MNVLRPLRVVAPILLIAFVAFVAVRLLDEPDGMRVSDIDSLNEQGVIYVPELKVFVVANHPRPLALSAIDPHLGHRDLYCPTSEMFEGAHGEKFDRLGFYFSGPAPRGLDRVAVHLDGNAVYVDPNERTQGPPRGAGNPEPAGRFCPEGPPEFIAVTE